MSRRRGGVLDNISEMPEEVLVMILCRLPIRDAVATSTLSKRWQPLWSKLNKLNFDGTETWIKMNLVPKFMNQVNSVIHKYNQPIVQENGDHTPRIIEDFRICFFLSRVHHGVIDEWLQFALSKKLKVLELGLIGSVYEFPSGLLQRNLLMMVGLKELILRNVKFRDEFFEEVVTNCSHLEKIVIRNSSLLKHIRVDGQVGNLQHIEIRRCWYLETIYLSDFDLCSFTYEGTEIDLRLTNLPKLTKIDMGEQGDVRLMNISNNVFSQISSCSSSLHTFSFMIFRPEENSKLDSLPALPNIRNLRLNISGFKVNCLLKLASIVNACPNLETLTIQLLRCIPSKDKKAKRVAIHPLKHLKLIQILCDGARITDFEIVGRVIKKCVRLKKIVVDPRLQSSKEVNATSTFISNNEDYARSYAIEYFGCLTPSGAELTVL